MASTLCIEVEVTCIEGTTYTICVLYIKHVTCCVTPVHVHYPCMYTSTLLVVVPFLGITCRIVLTKYKTPSSVYEVLLNIYYLHGVHCVCVVYFMCPRDLHRVRLYKKGYSVWYIPGVVHYPVGCFLR